MDLTYFLPEVPGQPSLTLVIEPSVSKTSPMQEARLTYRLSRKGR